MTSSESKAGSRLLAGTCRCGAVRYEVSDAFVYAANCHCSGCRAATGSAFKAFAGIERERLTISTNPGGYVWEVAQELSQPERP
jgi:hypothetical protein